MPDNSTTAGGTQPVSISKIKQQKIDLDRDSGISKRARLVEYRYHLALTKVTTLIMERIGVINPQTNIDISQIQMDFSDYVKETNRSFVESLYSLGGIYVNSSNNSIYFTTDIDLQNIKNISDEATNLYFLKVWQFLKREQEIDYLAFTKDIIGVIMKANPRERSKRSFKIQNNISNLVTTISTRAINAAIISKTRQILNIRNQRNIITKSAALNEFEFNTLTRTKRHYQIPAQYDLELAKEENREEQLDLLLQETAPVISSISPLVVFVTAADDRVCIDCRGLEGEIFDLNSDNIPIPPDDLHLNCRCRLLNMNESGNALIDLL